MEHRGPDSRGVHVEAGAGIAAQRLAIIDIAGGAQPMFNEDSTVAVVLNGEIYNYRELREALIRRGHRFRSQADTEVLVHLYEDHGEALVEHLRGMFAFAIWDRRRRRLLLARDRVGKKPLFWARRGERFWFASELRCLLQDPELRRGAELDPHAVASYLALQYVPHPLCAIKGIHKLAPASSLTVTREGEQVRRYWRLDYSEKLDHVPVPELEARLWEQIREATRIRLISDVPLGAFLSGGIDSSAVVAAMAHESPEPIKTFSIAFPDDAFNEARYARLLAERFGTDHHEFEVRPQALSIMPKIARHYGEPFGDPSAIPSFYLAELTRRHVTVALNGDGGDESFAGYPVYAKNGRVTRSLGIVPAPLLGLAPRLGARLGEGRHDNTLRSRISRGVQVLGMEPWRRHAMWMAAFRTPSQRARLLAPEFRAAAALAAAAPSDAGVSGDGGEQFIGDAWRQSRAPEPLDRMLDVDVQTYLPGDLLVKMDIATMAHSLEARSPLLDHELMAFAASLPANLKLRGRGHKWILRSALRRTLPPEILDRPKMGFSVPLPRWFRQELRHLPAEILLDPRTVSRGYFRRREVERIIREHHAGVVDHANRIWALLQLELWHREVLEAPVADGDGLFPPGAPPAWQKAAPAGGARADRARAAVSAGNE